jgi:transcriptional regulator GlxA family with amidase domain
VLIAFAVFDGITALDAIGPYEVLRMLPGAQVAFAGQRRGPVHAPSGLSLLATHAYQEIDGCDVLVVPGGRGARERLGDAELTGWIRRMRATATWTTSVCTGALLLGAAGLLDGLDATTHWSAREDLARFGARYVPDRVVRQGQVITAAGVSAGIDMALRLAALLTDEVTAQACQLRIEYDPQPPFDSGSLAKATPEVLAAAR